MLSVAKLRFRRRFKPAPFSRHPGQQLPTWRYKQQHWAIYPPDGEFGVPLAREVYSISEGYEPVAALALGYMIHKPCLKNCCNEALARTPWYEQVCLLPGSLNPLLPKRVSSQD